MLSKFETDPNMRMQFNALTENRLSAEDFAELEAQIRTDPAYLSAYVNHVFMISELQHYSEEEGQEIETPQNNLLWQLLCENENTADAVQISEASEKPLGYITPLPRIRLERNVSKPFLYSVLTSVAALLLLTIYLHFSPVEQAPIVARAGKAINAKWANPEWPVKAGDDLRAGPGALLEGIAEIRLDSGANVILQAPVVFEIESNMQINLKSGRLVASVPRQAIGFTIVTADATVVDYGTEFGVSVTAEGKTETHVFKGQVEMRNAPDPRVFEHSRRFFAGQAGKISEGTIVEMQIERSRFCRYVPASYEIAAKKLNPISMWRFDEQNGGQFMNELFDELSAVQSSQAKVVPISAKFGSALYFSGQPDQGYTIIERNPTETSAAYTYSFMICISQGKPQVIAVSKLNEDKTRLGRFFVINEQQQFEYYYTTESNPTKINPVHSETALQPDQWYHIILTGSLNGYRKIYINGQYEASSSATVGGQTDVHDIFDLGRVDRQYETIGYVPFQGYIGPILRFGRELTAEEIKTLYQSASLDRIAETSIDSHCKKS